MTILWNLAQMLAKEEFEQEGISSWDGIDKYDRQDRVDSMYRKVCKDTDNLRTKNLKMIEGEWHMRDPKTGRFVSTKATTNSGRHCVPETVESMKRFCEEIEEELGIKEELNNETTNTNSNKKGNDTMMNKTNVERRMETLKANGVNTENFFDLSMRIPFGAEVKIVVDGKEMVIPVTNEKVTATAYGNHVVENGLIGNYVGVPAVLSSNGDICNAETGEVLVMANDPIAQSIINDGYVKNSSLFRRYIFAHTMRMLEYVDRNNSHRKGWEACMKDCYSYGYQFDMMADELHTLAKLQKEDREYFEERTRFFNGNVAVTLLEDYLYRLKKYVKKQMRTNPKKFRGEQYVKLARYGNVLVKDLDAKVYSKILNGIANVKIATKEGTYRDIELAFRDFMNQCYNKLPYETPKCAVWKDSFKGIGAFESLKNAIRFHNVVLDGCKNKYDSERELYSILANTPNSDVWVFHNLLKSTLELNNFDLKKSIANGNAAPNTTSTRANVYKR